MATEGSDAAVERALRLLEAYLHERGLRVTPERRAIVEAVYGMENGHFTIEELCARLEENHFRVALATLYNNMEMLTEAGIIWSHHFGTAAMYEAAIGVAPHYHCICRDCGQVTNLTSERLTSRLAETRIRGFKADYAYIYLYGLCTKCSRKAKRRNNIVNRKRTR